jgi:hypothetical protein
MENIIKTDNNIIINIPLNYNINSKLPDTSFHVLYLKLNINSNFHSYVKNKMSSEEIILYSETTVLKHTVSLLEFDYPIQLFSKIELTEKRNTILFDQYTTKGIIIFKNDISNIIMFDMYIHLKNYRQYIDLLELNETDDKITISNIKNYENISDNLIFIPFDDEYKFGNLTFAHSNSHEKFNFNINIIKPPMFMYEVQMNMLRYMYGMCGLIYPI